MGGRKHFGFEADPPPEVLARADTPLGEWVLRRHRQADGLVYEIVANGTLLMDSSEPSSERALADLVLGGFEADTVLVGGLGLGYTLAAVLEHDVRRVLVAEIAAPLIQWSRGPLAPLLAGPLADSRVAVRCADVLEVARDLPNQCDAILLDVDNGPEFLVHAANASIYTHQGLQTFKAALAPGGRLAIWSSTRAGELVASLKQCFETVRVHELAVSRPGERELRYFIMIAAG